MIILPHPFFLVAGEFSKKKNQYRIIFSLVYFQQTTRCEQPLDYKIHDGSFDFEMKCFILLVIWYL